VPSSSVSSSLRSPWTDPDDEGTVIFQNVGKHSLNDTVVLDHMQHCCGYLISHMPLCYL